MCRAADSSALQPDYRTGTDCSDTRKGGGGSRLGDPPSPLGLPPLKSHTKMVEAELLTAVKKCLDEHLNCLGIEGNVPSAGRWD
ncbi:uncharacterized protein LOC127578505 isoform X2 [Pristis pectinata]|uniref:uncharacterized protein LOC127578505 isoform X2 n=1 Tax=Pristis pectinata TaxID=685728 RepID=UPI00223E256C|nr:uncharacterized protein LOC127578505 isoform X2 [Pristis pectinata]